MQVPKQQLVDSYLGTERNISTQAVLLWYIRDPFWEASIHRWNVSYNTANEIIYD
jgi:hypothetical protein